MRWINLLGILLLAGCSSTESFVDLHVRDATTHEPLARGYVSYEFHEWVPYLIPPLYYRDVAIGAGPVRDGTARIYIRPSRPIRLELTDAPGYPPITVVLQAPRNLKDFEPTPWVVGSVVEPTEGASQRLLEFRLAPQQR